MTSRAEKGLRAAGFRLTPARRAVIAALEGAEAGMRPGELLSAARASCPGLGRATLYRTLRLLVSLGLAQAVPVPGGVRYRLLAGDVHRLVCRGCGAELPLDTCFVREAIPGLARRSGYRIVGHVLEIYGLCPDCRRRWEHAG